MKSCQQGQAAYDFVAAAGDRWVLKMTDRIIELNEHFSTADAEDVVYNFDGSDLVLRFNNWQEVPHTILFPDCVVVHWGVLPENEQFRYDSPYEIVDSNEIQKRGLNPNHFHHYMLCFNASSNIELISHQFLIREPEMTETQQSGGEVRG